MVRQKEQSSLEKQLFGLAIGQGVLAILFGVVALFLPGLTVALLIVLFSIFILIWGVVGIITSLSSSGTEKFWWLELVFSVLAVGLAVYMLRNPIDTAAVFIFFIGITFLVRGVVDILEGLFDGARAGNHRVFRIVVGVIGILAGVVTLAHPISAGVAVVWVIGLYAVLYGSMLVAFSFKTQNELNR